MRKKGAVSELGPYRDRELMSAYKKAFASTRIVSSRCLYELAANSPASRFWVSERRASEVLSAMEKGISIQHMSPTRIELFRDLFKIYSHTRKSRPGISIIDATAIAVNSPAPKFYLTPNSAKIILARFKRNKTRS